MSRKTARNLQIIGLVVLLALLAAGLAFLLQNRFRVRLHVERLDTLPPSSTNQPAPTAAPAKSAPTNTVIVTPPSSPLPVSNIPAPLIVRPSIPTQVVARPPAPPPAEPRKVEPVTPTSNRITLPTNMLAILRAQIALDREGISSGSLDGKIGKQTRSALMAYQKKQGIPPTGEWDEATRTRLVLRPPVFVKGVIQQTDLDALQPLATNWLGKSLQSHLGFETILEAMAERYHSHPVLLQRLNPNFNWNAPVAGSSLLVPSVKRPIPETKATLIRIRLGERIMDVFDEQGRLLAHFPCSIAQRIEKRPVGELRIAVVAPDPDYTFDPDVFPESSEARALGRKLILPPGPNNPVGSVWLGLNKPGYGIHGTPKPEDVGRTESKGCFRLANWNASHLLKLVTAGPSGTKVRVEP